VGVEEDPATGSAAGPLGAYLVRHRVVGGREVTISQGAEVGRPSTLIVRVEGDSATLVPEVGGGVFVVGQGEFALPD
jgi:trans-2,3-dihydro-3-hydroxyanthranilate isomerase